MVPFESLDTVSYSHSVATMTVSSAVSTQYTNMTDTHDTQTEAIERRHRPRLRTASRGKKILRPSPHESDSCRCTRENGWTAVRSWYDEPPKVFAHHKSNCLTVTCAHKISITGPKSNRHEILTKQQGFNPMLGLYF